MSDAVIISAMVLFAGLIVVFVFRKAWNKDFDDAKEGIIEISPTKFSIQFRRDAAALKKDTVEVEETAKMMSTEPVGPTAAQLALPDGNIEHSGGAAPDSGVTGRDLMVVGADWAGLITKVKRFLDENDIPVTEGESSLGELLQIINEEWPGILPDRTVDVARRADQLLENLMTAQASEIKHEDVSLFSDALMSLHRITSKITSRARQSGHRRPDSS
jgi:hypothetical protein